MTEFAENNTDIAEITDENISAGFDVCQKGENPLAMPFTTNYVNAAFKWVCEKVDVVGSQIANINNRFNTLNISNIGSGSSIFRQRAGDTFQLRSILGGKGLQISQSTNEINIAQTVMCCYSELGFSAGPPSNTFVSSILVDDLTDPAAPITYIWSCKGQVYTGLESSGAGVPMTTPLGTNFTVITSIGCDGTTSGVISNTNNTYDYTATVTAGLQINSVFVDGVQVADVTNFKVPNDTDTVAVNVSGIDPTGGQISGSLSITYTDGTVQGTAQNVPASLECFVPVAPPSVPASSGQTIACVDLPETITGFANVTRFTTVSSIDPATSDYIVTPNAGNTEITINGIGGAETLTVTASNGNVAEDVEYIINITPCSINTTFTSTTGETPIVSNEDFEGFTQTWTVHTMGGLPNLLTSCGTSIQSLELFRRQSNNGGFTEYDLIVTGGVAAEIASFTFDSPAAPPVTIQGGLSSTRILTQVQYNAVRTHIENASGYTVTFTCA